MPELQGSRRHLKIAIAVMVAADVVAAAVLFSPLVGSADSRRQQMNQLTVRVALQDPRRGTVARHGQENRVGERRDQAIL